MDHAHGRTEIRTLHTHVGLDGWSAWPGLAQVCRLVNQTRRGGKWQVELHYKITSLRPDEVGPAELLQLSRGHWAIENQLHYVRDVTFGEDVSRIRSGAAPQAMAALRNVAITLLKLNGATNRAAGVRPFSWHPERAVAALGLVPTYQSQATSAA